MIAIHIFNMFDYLYEIKMFTEAVDTHLYVKTLLGIQGIHPGFKTQGRRHQKSKTGESVAPRKGFMSSKILRKKTLLRKWAKCDLLNIKKVINNV